MIVNPGSKVPLSALLADGDGTKYVRAFLYTNGAPFSTPVVDLAHVAKGRYENTTVDMPDAILHAVYQAFVDPGFNTLADYYAGADVFQPVRVTEQVHQLEGTVDALEVAGELGDGLAEGEAQNLQELAGEVETAEVTGLVETAQADAEVGEQDIEGEAGC